MRVLNIGSLNVDHVYRVPHIAKPGETIAGTEYRRFAGGKGANQSVALARAGASVMHAGLVGEESVWLRERLADEGIDVELVRLADAPGGHAVIQVDASGQNSIVLYGGANREIGEGLLADAFERVSAGDILLVQNEINCSAECISRGAARGLTVCLNPAPMSADVVDYPLSEVDVFILNEHEAGSLSGESSPERALAALATRFPEGAFCLTLGERGVLYRDGARTFEQAAFAVDAVDTTAAGDTFIGYLIAEMAAGGDMESALCVACRAAALSVTRAGAMDSIPLRSAVLSFRCGAADRGSRNSAPFRS